MIFLLCYSLATQTLMVPELSPELLEKEDNDEDEQSMASAIDELPPKRGKKNKREKACLIKAPQAPKRFKSSYICFFMSRQPYIKHELGEHASVSEVSKRSAELWRNLPQEERVHWDQVAAKDKDRYWLEKSQYTGPWQVTKKKTKKDPSAPKRPMSAFLYFSQGRRQAIKDQNPDIVNTEVSRVLGVQWRNATDEEKEPFIRKEREEREIYKVAIASWRNENERKKDGERLLRDSQIAQQYAQQPLPYGSQDASNQRTYHSSMNYSNGSSYGGQPSSPPRHDYNATGPPHYYGTLHRCYLHISLLFACPSFVTNFN
jgi:high mobility group protein B3